MLFYTRKNKRAIQMMAAAAMVTTIAVPYVVNVDTVAAASTTQENVDYLFTAGEDFENGTAMDSYFKTNFINNVSLELDEDGSAYALITLGGHSYGIENFQVNGKNVEVVSETGSVDTKDLVRTARVALDENYQAKITYSSERGEGSFLFDLATEDADYVLTTGGNEAYFSQWIKNADVVTKVDGSKVAYITFGGHSYATALDAEVISSTGSAATADLVRVVRVNLDENNQAAVKLDGGEKGSYTFAFDFSEQEAVTTIKTVADVTAKAQAIDFAITAGMPDQFIVPGVMTAKSVQAKDGKVSFTLNVGANASERGAYESLTIKQGDTALATWTTASGAETVSFAVDTVENLTLEVGYKAATAETATTYKGSIGAVTFAEVDDTVKEPVVTPEQPEVAAEIPSTTGVGLRADYTFVTDTSTISSATLAEFLKTYFHHGFFGNANIVEIDGQTYVDLGLIAKSVGFDPIEYQLADGTFAKANIIEKGGKSHEDFTGTVRIPVTAVNGEYNVTIRTTGSQPGAEQASVYSYDFSFKNAVNKFTDVTANKEEVQALYLHNITNGKTDTTFVPNGSMKRYEFAVMIARALELDSTTTSKFTDVQGKWYASSVQALFEAGIISGTSETTFNPAGTVSRQQAAKMIGGMLEYLKYDATATLADLKFQDAGDISDYAKLHIAELQKQGIMTGSNGKVNPKSVLTRGQMAKVLKRSLDLVNYFE